MRHSLSIILPMLNEEENVEPVTKELAQTLEAASIPYEIICVSNGSTDRTEEFITTCSQQNPHIRGIFLREKGYGLAITTGFKTATTDLLTIVSGDGQVDPHDIVKAYEIMERTDVDIVKPRRTHRSDGWHRAFLAAAHTILLKIVFGLPGWDIDAPPKIIKRAFAERLHLENKEFSIDDEIMIKTHHIGGTMAELDVGWRTRKHGTPHVARAILKVSWCMFKNIMRWRLHYRALITDKISPPSPNKKTAGEHISPPAG